MKCSDDITIFSELTGGKLPPAEKQPRRLTDEANIFMIAGGEAITQLLIIVSYHLIANPYVLAKLREKLDVAMPTLDREITWCELEKLPYLGRPNHLDQGLWISAIFTTQLPRVAPNDMLRYESFDIPPGVRTRVRTFKLPVLIRSLDSCIDDFSLIWILFFGQDHWKFLVPFSKGSRGCVGMNLAHAQAYLVIAKVFRRFDFDSYKTSQRDFTIVRDCFNGQPYKGCKGVRAFVTRQRA
ncbi:cytochrome P450 [Aureobasidium namibiae CBS 147.97]|uniref:Cytochrome P450 n=1 Tax=Aureobasidium namibiae CBS 147.97 TaxID=1043004 RepID=A0A074WAU0_9PEZI|nr:cytochrome P450 [Aureobasidium namibiae CBS 147.97]KEQ68684.1 cytochrome P450 [Aureobasidium namibiae CBS 147.97]